MINGWQPVADSGDSQATLWYRHGFMTHNYRLVVNGEIVREASFGPTYRWTANNGDPILNFELEGRGWCGIVHLNFAEGHHFCVVMRK